MESDTVIEAAPDKDCHLLRMPPELRLRIYDFYFGEEKACIVVWDEDDVKVRWQRDQTSTANESGSGLLRTCKTVHVEALPVLHAQCNLSILCNGDCHYYNHEKKNDTTFTAVRELDQHQQCGFLASIAKAEVWLCFECAYVRVEDMRTAPQLFTAMKHGQNTTQLTINMSVKHVEEQLAPITELLGRLRCEDTVCLGSHEAPETGWYISEEDYRVLLRAANANVPRFKAPRGSR
ncbi:hypothetical protein LTR36_009016 [Oleoguttula mirabilis]|uniref:Uncharacterized protein n=1 Tax=Oleoguttula mirabilis TaxID=1507867 RepID=A0AAV9J6W0_9PEZI|nr:hypothetical protein LTR36_009016 [Oleoguttula mirabilis]